MSTFTKRLLSGSTSGRPIKVGASSSPGTTIHTAVAGSDDFDEVWIYVSNTDTVERKVTIEFGGVTDPDDHEVMTIDAGETELVVGGEPLQGGLIVKAFGAAADVLTAHGFVNRVTA